MIDVETQKLWDKFDNDIEKRSYIMRILLVLDQLFNVVFLNGSQDQTTSGHIAKRQYEKSSNWFMNKLCIILKKIEAKHCWLSRKE